MTTKAKEIKSFLIKFLRNTVGAVTYEKIRARQYLGYWPNIHEPKTLNEKIIQAKLFRIPSSAVMLSDKVAVRDFVKGIIGENYLNKLYFSGDSLTGVDFSALPEKFIIKANNGCEGNIIIREKSKANIQDIDHSINHFLSKSFGYLTNEIWYLDIKPQILIEELMEDEKGNIPDDYKFFCFNGVCKMIQVNKDRFSNHNILFYDEEWNKFPFGLSHYPYAADLSKPENFDEMKNIAEKLSKNIEFVRVDLYSYNKTIKFGEMTFAPNAGWKPFTPNKYDLILGSLW